VSVKLIFRTTVKERQQMARDEGRQAREEGRGGRRGAAEATEVTPLVSSKRGKFETLTNTKIEAPIFGRFKDYKAFVAELEGEEPEDGAVISAGLEMLFEADKGFERWLTEQRRKGRNGSGANGNGAHGAGDNAAATLADAAQDKGRRAEARGGE
jgi:hypothetical protein